MQTLCDLALAFCPSFSFCSIHNGSSLGSKNLTGFSWPWTISAWDSVPHALCLQLTSSEGTPLIAPHHPSYVGFSCPCLPQNSILSITAFATICNYTFERVIIFLLSSPLGCFQKAAGTVCFSSLNTERLAQGQPRQDAPQTSVEQIPSPLSNVCFSRHTHQVGALSSKRKKEITKNLNVMKTRRLCLTNI